MKSERFLFEGKAPDLLESDIARGEVSHSYLIWGPRGIGKSELAERFATAVNCTGERKGPLGYCGTCPSCYKMMDNVLVDYNVKRPTRALRRERGTEIRSSKSSIKIEDVREMIEDIYLKPNEAKRKFWVLEDVHTMEERMLNSLLKVLEEPPGDSVVVLTADSPDDLLPTVVSRCRQVKMLRPGQNELAGWLSSERGIDAKKAAMIAKAADHLPGRALVMADDPCYWPLREAMLNTLLDTVLEGGLFAAQRGADKMQLLGTTALEEGLNGSEPADPDGEAGRLASGGGIIEYIAAFLKDLAYLRAGMPIDAVTNVDRVADLSEASSRMGADEWLRRATRAFDLSTAVTANANFRLALDEAMFLASGDSI